MRKRKYVIGALLSVIGALVVSSSASAAVTGQTLTTTTSPAKQQKKTFGPVGAFTNVVDTAYTGGVLADRHPDRADLHARTSSSLRATSRSATWARSAPCRSPPSDATCGASKVGSGEATINGGILTGKVAAYNGIPSGGSPTIGLHTDVFTSAGTYAFSTTLTGILNTRQQHADRLDPADRYVDHAFLDDDQQEEVGQEEGSDDLLRDGSLQEEEVGQLGDDDLQQRSVDHRDEHPEVQAEAVQEVRTTSS